MKNEAHNELSLISLKHGSAMMKFNGVMVLKTCYHVPVTPLKKTVEHMR